MKQRLSAPNRGKQIAGLLLSAILLVVSTIALGTALPKSYAANPTAGSYNEDGYPTDHCYYLMSGGVRYPAYCTESIAPGPNAVEYRVRSRNNVSADLMRGIDYILYYGYDNDHTSDDHYGTGMSGWNFMKATQYAVWEFIGSDDRSRELSGTGYHNDVYGGAYGPDWRTIGSNWGSAVAGLKDQMVSEARAHCGETSGPWVGFATPYTASGSQGLVWTGSRSGYLKITKGSSDSSLVATNANYMLVNAQYGIFSDANCSNRVATITIKADGTSDSITLSPGTYYIKEIAAPSGHLIDDHVYSATVTSGSTSNVDTTDQAIYGHVQVRKINAATGGVVARAGFKFSIYAQGSNTAIETATTGRDGIARFQTNLPLGNYEVKETEVIEPFDLSTTAIPVTLAQSGSEGDLVGGIAVVDWTGTTKSVMALDMSDTQHGYVKIRKQSWATGEAVVLPGFKFDLYDSSNTKVATATTGEDGSALFCKLNATSTPAPLPMGNYYAKETYAPAPFYLDADTRWNVTLTPSGNIGDLSFGYHDPNTPGDVKNTVDDIAKNRQWGHIKVTKKNASTGNTVTKNSFKFYLYKQNRNWNASGNARQLVGVAVTDGGVAYFMEPNGTNPGANIAKLPVKNTHNLDEGYYEVVEESVAEPFYKNTGTYRVILKAQGNAGETVADISSADGAVLWLGTNPKANNATIGNQASETRNNIKNVTPIDVPDIPYGYLKATKKNTATAGTVVKQQFRFALYEQNAARSLPKEGHLIGIAVTSKGATQSGTTVPGEAVFMEVNAQGQMTNTPVKLPVRNKINPNQGYYDVYETDVVEPFWLTDNCYQVTIDAKDDNGATKSAIDSKASDTKATIFNLAGQPVAKITNSDQDGQGVTVPSSPTATLKNNQNTTQLAIANDQYAFIEIVKKNMELGKSGQTVTQAGFKFKLYDTLDNAKNETNALEEVTTDASGKVAFLTKLSIKGTARNDPSGGSQRIHIASQTSNPTDRNDGVYYVRESYAMKPYNKSNAIYRFTITADGNEGNVSYTVDVANFGSPAGTVHNNPYTTDFKPYPNGNGIAVHDLNAAGFSGTGINNVCPTTLEDAPQYGRIKITKTDAKDGSFQQGAEYQIYPAESVTYVGAGGVYTGSASGNQRTPTAGNDTVANDSGAKKPAGYTKLSPHSDGIGANIGTYSVNAHPDIQGSDASKIRHTANTDVARVVNNLPAGQSTFNEANGKVTVTNPVVFTRADGTQYDTIVTDANGEATTGWLPIDADGTTRYYIVEVKTSNGHVIDGNRFYVDLVYDATLQDRECIVASKDTTNNKGAAQQDGPNSIEVLKKVALTPANPDGGVLGDVTVGFWKTEDDIEHNKNTNGVKPQANNGTYAFDSVVIRTFNHNNLVPVVHQRVAGTETYVKELPDGYAIRLVDPDKKDSIVFDGQQVGHTETISSGTYDVEVVDTATDEVVKHSVLQQIELHEGDRTGLEVTVGLLSGDIAVNASSSPIEIRASNLTYKADLDAFVATNLKAGANYEVEFDRKIVKVIQTSASGGKVWFGRYATDDSQWFNKGWLDQAALPTNDSRIITSTLMKVDDKDVFTTNTTPLTTGNQTLHTTGNHSWLQDTSTQRAYDYETITNGSGAITNERIGAGEYVIAEIKPPVNYKKHTTYLPDTYAHHFKVDDITGYITDTDAGQNDQHNSTSHQVAKKQSFTFVDEDTKLELSKYEVTGSKELVGAELILTADNNDVIDRWISTDQPHYIENLKPGWYTLTEYATPKNYDKAESVRFNLLPDNEVQHCIMYDKPISIDAEIDKKQEIATPLGDQDFPNGDGKNRADAQDNDLGLYAYSLDFRSTSNTWTDEFTVEDPLEPANQGYAKLLSIVTPQAFQDYDGKMNVWYKTNLMAEDYQDLKEDEEEPAPSDIETDATDAPDGDDQGTAGDSSTDESGDETDTAEQPVAKRKPTGSTKYVANATLDDGHENPWLRDDDAMVADPDGDGRIIDYTGWKLWKKEIPAAVATKLDVSELGLAEGEYVTGFRFEYGRVEVGFTSRVDGWDDELLHYEHDDKDHINGLSSQSFQAAGTAADAAIARMQILTGRFTTDMSFMLEDIVAQQRQKAREDYEQGLIDIDVYNQQIAQLNDGTLPKFAEAIVKPAYVDGTEDVQRLDQYLEASKSSLQAAFPLATYPGARDLLLLTSRQAVADLAYVVSPETYDNLNARIQDYQDEIDRIPSDSGGYDIDHANEELMNAFIAALDDIRTFGLSGRTMYAPAVLHMQLTDRYVPGVTMKNSAKVDAYRNGGNNDGKPRIGTRLTNKADGSHAVGASGLVTVVDEVDYFGLTPGKEYTMSGELHRRKNVDGVETDAGVLEDDGKPVSASTTFTPDSADGTVKLEFQFHAELLNGDSAVAFEECRLTSDGGDDTGDDGETPEVLEHNDITDGWQTVNENGDVDLPESSSNLEGHDQDEVIQTPRRKNDIFIGTRLATIDNQKIVSSDGTESVVLTDLVDYHNLIPGRKYQMDGVLHVRAYDSVKKAPIDGGAISGSKGSVTFIPEQPDGTVEVKLIMPASEVLYKPVVAYEELKEVKEKNGVASEIVVATHEDITNEDQTVMVTMLDSDVVNQAPLIQTGDRISLLAIGSLLATIGTAAMVRQMRRSREG